MGSGQGFTIGEGMPTAVRVETPLLLAPMEDVTSLAMRTIAKSIANPGLVFTEFISAMAVHYNASRTIRKMRLSTEERPVGIQIFGADPATMAESARLAAEMGADLIDINMGCWVPKVCKTGAGAALLKDPDTAAAVVRAVVDAVRLPVTIKVRAGFGHGDFTAPAFVRRLVGEGAKMVTLHARFASQGHEGNADWTLISRLREAIPDVPLVGNGDVRTPEDALRLIRETGCDGVMMGRAAISNPWALRDVARALRNEPALPPPSIEERIEAAKLHARLTVQAAIEEEPDRPQEAERHAIRSLRGQLPIYVKGVPGAAEIRAEMYRSDTLEDVDAALARIDTLASDPIPA